MLLDDNPELAEEWEEKSGTFIRHTSTQRCHPFPPTKNRSSNLLQPVVLVSVSENAYDKTYLKI